MEARIHYRIACIRNDAHHKATTAIVNKISAIGIETLKVTNMLKNKKLSKALSDAASREMEAGKAVWKQQVLPV